MSSTALRRSSSDKVIAGVCAGVARHFGLPVAWVRLGAVALVLLEGFGLIVYALAWLLIPAESRSSALAQRQSSSTAPPRRALILGAAGCAVLGVSALVNGVSFPFWIVFVVCLVIALKLAKRANRGRRSRPTLPATPGSASFDQAKAAWLQRLETYQLDSQRTRNDDLTLPSSLLEAASLWPDSIGFQPNPPAVDPFQIDSGGLTAPLPAVPWSASPAPAGSGDRSVAPPFQQDPPPTSGPTSAAPPSSSGAGLGPSRPASATVAPLGPAMRLSHPDPTPVTALGSLDPAGSVKIERLTGSGPMAEPIQLAAFFAHASPAPHHPTGTAVAVRRRHPALVGWLTLLALAGSAGGLSWVFGPPFYDYPYLLAVCWLGLVGLALLVSPWAGRPRWLSPLAGCLVALTALLPVLEWGWIGF
ncbi:MAG: PspC domain-containing protein [Propionibacteriaceae bacterium]|nr:PspC domain-containing protein [Propionibacteriaceae bacterium]